MSSANSPPPLPPSATYTELPRPERYLAHDQNGRSGAEPLFAPSKLMLFLNPHGVDMRAPLPLLVLAPLIVCAPAQAEFLLVPSPDPGSTDAAAPAIRPHKPQIHVLRAPQDPLLQGFGHRIPLTFAVRQIVPAHFQVAFADAVQKDARGRLEGRRAMAGDPRRRRAPAWARRHCQRTQGDDRGRPSSLNGFSAEPPSLFAPSSLRLSHVHMETA